MRELVALLLPGGPAFVAALESAWASGDAVLPLDPAAPAPHLERVIAQLAPTMVVESDGERRRLHGGTPVEAGDALVVATSGTTGDPKGAVHTHEGIEHAAFATSVAAGVAADARWLACLPLSHVGGLSVVTRALVTGVGLEVHPRLDPAAVEDAARRGATHVSLVPTALRRIDPARWTTILLGGSSIPAQRPSNTIATYGMTESFGGVVYDGLRLDSVEVRIIDADSTQAASTQVASTRHTVEPRLAAAGVAGPIELRAPSLLRTYRGGVDPKGPSGWYRTGDLGLIEPVTGLLVVLGRADDLIITGGEKVWPGPVEDVLARDTRIREVAVIGRADPEWGHRVVAVVVPVDHLDPPTLDSLREQVRRHLPVSAAPKQLELVDSLPRTGLGKIRRTSISGAGTTTTDDTTTNTSADSSRTGNDG